MTNIGNIPNVSYNNVLQTNINGKPYITVSSKGITNGLSTIPNNGADFGPDTVGTTTSGINEAINSLPLANTSAPYSSGGGKIVLEEGQYNITGTITIPNTNPFNLTLEGAGLTNTVIIYGGTSDVVVTAYYNTSDGTSTGTLATGSDNTLQLYVRNIGFVYNQGGTQAHIFNLGGINTGIFEYVLLTTYNGIESTVGGNAGYGIDPGMVSTTPLGVVGVRLYCTDNNNIEFHQCQFITLAVGVDLTADHTKFFNNFFSTIGMYYDTTTSANVWSNVYGNTSWLEYGAAIYFNGTQSVANMNDPELVYNHFFMCQSCVLDGHTTAIGYEMELYHGYIETCLYSILTINNAVARMYYTQINEGAITTGQVAQVSLTAINTTPSAWSNVQLIGVISTYYGNSAYTTGDMLAGPGILGTANTYSALQTFGAGLDISASNNIIMNPIASTSITTTENSGYIDLLGSYYNGTASVPYGFRLQSDITATTPTGNLNLNLNNNGTITNLLNIDQSGNINIISGNIEFHNAGSIRIAYGNINMINGSYPNSIACVYLNLGALQTTIAGTTAGSIIASQPFQGTSYKKVVIYLSGYENDTTTAQTYTYDTAFTNTPIITANNSGLTPTTVSTTAISFNPDNTTAYTGFIILEGY